LTVEEEEELAIASHLASTTLVMVKLNRGFSSESKPSRVVFDMCSIR